MDVINYKREWPLIFRLRTVGEKIDGTVQGDDFTKRKLLVDHHA